MRVVFISILIVFFVNAYKAQSPILDSLKTELKKAKHDTARCNLLYQMIEEEYDDKIWPIYNEKLKNISLKNLNNNSDNIYTKYYAEALNNEGYIANIHNESAKAIKLFYKSLTYQEKIKNYNGVATVFGNIANVYQNTGNINKSIEFYIKGLNIYLILKDDIGIGRAYNNLGFIYDDLGDIPLALDYYHKSLKIRERIKDNVGTAACLNNIAVLYHKQNETQKAKEYYYRSYKLQCQENDIIGSANTLANIGSLFQYEANEKDQKKLFIEANELLKKALSHYQQALKIQIDYEDKIGIAGTYSNIGTIYSLFSNHFASKSQKDSLIDNALTFFNSSLKIREEINDKKGLVLVLNKIAQTQFKAGDINTSKINAEKSFKISNELGFPTSIELSAELLSQIYAQQKDFKNAFIMHKLYKQMSDSVFNTNNEKEAAKKSYKYEYEKKAAADSVKVFEEKKVTTAQLKQEKTQRFALYGGLVLVALFGVFMFNRFKVTQKQNHIIQIQKSELQHQKEIVDEKQKEMLDSIHYAKRIQNALIANTEFINKHLDNNFIYFNPKDIVSGDFYWATHCNNQFYLAVCDSTGHGVPGAFMSLLNIGFLSEAIKEKNITKPHEVLNYVRQRLINTMSNEGQKDGMDGILICYDKESNTLEYAAANNAPILIRNNEIVELSKDKMPIGQGEKIDSFTLHTVSLQKGDGLYLYTDGFADQFGGPESGKGGKKFKYKPLNNLLVQNTNLPLSEQSVILQSVFNNWKGNLEQVDDVCVIGIKI